MGCNMLDAQTQTQLTGNRIETVWKEIARLRQAKYNRTSKKRKRAKKLIVDQIKREDKGEGPRDDDNENENGD